MLFPRWELINPKFYNNSISLCLTIDPLPNTHLLIKVLPLFWVFFSILVFNLSLELQRRFELLHKQCYPFCAETYYKWALISFSRSTLPTKKIKKVLNCRFGCLLTKEVLLKPRINLTSSVFVEILSELYIKTKSRLFHVTKRKRVLVFFKYGFLA
jgi:hypothetical protein